MAEAAEIINKEYKKIIDKEYPLYSAAWPVLSGHDVLNGEYGNYIICVLRHTGNLTMRSSSVTSFNSINTGVAEITPANIENVREKVREYFSVSKKDSVVILSKDGVIWV